LPHRDFVQVEDSRFRSTSAQAPLSRHRQFSVLYRHVKRHFPIGKTLSLAVGKEKCLSKISWRIICLMPENWKCPMIPVGDQKRGSFDRNLNFNRLEKRSLLSTLGGQISFGRHCRLELKQPLKNIVK